MTTLPALRFAAILGLAAGCGGESKSAGGSEGGVADASSGQASRDAEAGPDGSATANCPFTDGAPEGGRPSASRTPKNHRPAGSACPQPRAAISPEASTCAGPDASSCGTCAADSDCTAGPNGRCGNTRSIGYKTCSYDTCFDDSDCDGGGPCQCRASSSSLAANACLATSDCRVDSDCPDSYCSPSVLNFCFCPSTALCGDSGLPSCSAGGVPVPCACGDSCGHGYFCHTPCDTCIDDSDCSGQGTCNYDTLIHRWRCAECWPVP